MAKVKIIALESIARRLGFKNKRRARFSHDCGKGETLEGLVRLLAADHPALADITYSQISGALTPDYRIHLNRTKIPFFDWPTTLLRDGDEVLLRRAT